MKKESLKVANVLCGSGGGALGFKQAGFELVYANDLDLTSAYAFQTNHHLAVEVSDVAAIKIGLVPDFDVLYGAIPMGGIPAEGWSLQPHVINAIAKLVTCKKPAVICLETCRGHLEPERFLEMLTPFTELGYSFAFRGGREHEVAGTPLNRSYFFMIGFLDPAACARLGQLPKGPAVRIEDVLEDQVPYHYYLTPGTRSEAQQYWLKTLPMTPGVYSYRQIEESSSYAATFDKVKTIHLTPRSRLTGYLVRDAKGVRDLTLNELKRCKGLPYDFKVALSATSDIVSARAQYTQLKRRLSFTTAPALTAAVAGLIREALQ